MHEPRDWNDAKRMIESLEKHEEMEMQKHSLKPSSFAQRVNIEYNKMFYIGILYGMSLEAHKDRPLRERGQL